MNETRSAIITLLLLILSWGQVLPQESADSTLSYNLDSITVTAGRYPLTLKSSPLSVDLIEAQSLQGVNNLLTIKDAFIKVPGLIVNNRFNQAQGDKIMMRGIGSRTQFGVRGIKILLDGVPLTLPDGQSSLNNLNIAAVKRVDIIRGPSSVLYGNASGGIMYFDTRQKGINNFFITPSVTAGSFGLVRADADLGGNVLGGSWSANAYTSGSDGFRNHSGSRFSGINLTTDHNLSDKVNMTSVINYYDSPFLLNPSTLNKEDSKNDPEKVRGFILRMGAGKKVRQLQAGIILDYSLATKSNFRVTFFGASRSLFNSIPGRIIELERLTGGVRTEFNIGLNLLGAETRWMAGVDLENQFDNRTEFINQGVNNESLAPEDILDNITYGDKILEQDEMVTGLGIFSVLDISMSEKLNVSLGARYDNFVFRADDKFFDDGFNDTGEATMDEVSPLIGFSYNFSPSKIFYANYSTSFQTPTTSELSNNQDGSGGFNENLKPENMDIIEAGFRGYISGISTYYNASIYSLRIKNMLVPYQVEDESSEEVYYRNAGESRNNGFEAAAQWQPGLDYYLAASYTYMNFKYETYIIEEIINDSPAERNLSGNSVPGIPKNILNVVAGYNILSNLLAEIRFNWTDSYFANDYNGETTDVGADDDHVNDEFTTFGLLFIYTLPINNVELQLKAGIENLFDVRYNGSVVPNAAGKNYFEPASGRAAYITLYASF